MRALATVRPTSRRRRRTSARSESSSAREIVTISDASALTCHSPRLDAAPPSLGCTWSVLRQPALWCLCHLRATNDSIRRSAAVAHGHSPALYLDRRRCSSLGGQGDRSCKLVMRFRLPPPAPLIDRQFSNSAAALLKAAGPAVGQITPGSLSMPGHRARAARGHRRWSPRSRRRGVTQLSFATATLSDERCKIHCGQNQQAAPGKHEPNVPTVGENKCYFGQADNPEPDTADQTLPGRPRCIPPSSPTGHVHYLAASIGDERRRRPDVNRSLTLTSRLIPPIGRRGASSSSRVALVIESIGRVRDAWRQLSPGPPASSSRYTSPLPSGSAKKNIGGEPSRCTISSL
jgi:hypothetical protein